MQKTAIFSGIATALITPMKDGAIDYPALDDIIDVQIASGIGAIVIAGTTGEGSALTDGEREELYLHAANAVGGRCPLILGTGSNDTVRAIAYTKLAERAGADGALIVTPYYNKGCDEGIARHYEKIAESTDIPIILYNVPSRTGVNLPLDVIKRLSENTHIVGIKEATDALDRQIKLYSMRHRINVYSGNDTQIYLNLALGGCGTVSVISNLFPRSTADIYDLYQRGEYEAAFDIQSELLPMISLIFADTNPAPIKYAMSLCTLCEEEMRLPLYPIKNDLRIKIYREYKRLCAKGFR